MKMQGNLGSPRGILLHLVSPLQRSENRYMDFRYSSWSCTGGLSHIWWAHEGMIFDRLLAKALPNHVTSSTRSVPWTGTALNVS